MKLGIAVEGDRTIMSVLDDVITAERLGFHSIWVSERVGMRDAVTQAALILANSRTIKVGLSGINPYSRHPALIAMALGAMEEFARGRILLHIGAGFPPSMSSIGIYQETPLNDIRESVEIIRMAVSGEPFSYAGKRFSIREMKLESRPAKPVPISILAVRPKMLRLAAQSGNGVALFPGATTDYVRFAVGIIEGCCFEFGRKREEIEIAQYLPVATAPTREEALAAAKAFLRPLFSSPLIGETARGLDLRVDSAEIIAAILRSDIKKAVDVVKHVSDEVAEALTVCGTPDQCTRRLEEYRDAGVDLPILIPCGSYEQRCLFFELAEREWLPSRACPLPGNGQPRPSSAGDRSSAPNTQRPAGSATRRDR